MQQEQSVIFETFYIYLISDGEFIKIGQSNNPKIRLDALQTANPRTLSLRKTYPVWAYSINEVENAAHRSLAAYRVRGEWFQCSYEIACEAVEAAVQGYNKAPPPPLTGVEIAQMASKRLKEKIEAQQVAQKLEEQETQRMIFWDAVGRPGKLEDFVIVPNRAKNRAENTARRLIAWANAGKPGKFEDFKPAPGRRRPAKI